MFRTVIFCLGLPVLTAQLAHAEVTPSDVTTRLVEGITTAFFDQLTKADFAKERAFMSDGLAAMSGLSDWTAMRQWQIDRAGPTPLYRAHAMTYYQQGGLLAAVDFWGKAAKPDTFICGFLLWEMPDPNTIGLSRIEENIVEVAAMRRMPVGQAAQLMTSFRCPKDLIETVLGVTLNVTN